MLFGYYTALFRYGAIEAFISFIRECNSTIIMKPLMGASGQGIFKADVSNDEKAISIFKK